MDPYVTRLIRRYHQQMMKDNPNIVFCQDSIVDQVISCLSKDLKLFRNARNRFRDEMEGGEIPAAEVWVSEER